MRRKIRLRFKLLLIVNKCIANGRRVLHGLSLLVLERVRDPDWQKVQMRARVLLLVNAWAVSREQRRIGSKRQGICLIVRILDVLRWPRQPQGVLAREHGGVILHLFVGHAIHHVVHLVIVGLPRGEASFLELVDPVLVGREGSLLGVPSFVVFVFVGFALVHLLVRVFEIELSLAESINYFVLGALAMVCLGWRV